MNETLNEQIIEAGNAQSPEPAVTTQVPQPSVSANPAVPEQQQPQQPTADDLPTLIAQAYAEDPVGTLQILAQHAGYQLVPAQQQVAAAPSGAIPDPWQQLILSIALNMWQGEASKQVETLAKQDGIELADRDLQQIFLDALEKYGGDVEVAYSKFALQRIRSKQNQPRKEHEQETEASDILTAIKLAGFR